VNSIIVTLNDDLHWTREKIAAWVDGIDPTRREVMVIEQPQSVSLVQEEVAEEELALV